MVPAFDAVSDHRSVAPAGLPDLPALLRARAPHALAGWRAGVAVDCAALVARMEAWHRLLARQPGRHYALYLDDSLECGAALLGAWQAGKTIWLSADTLDASCAALRASVDGFLGAFPAACAPLVPGGDDGAMPAPALSTALAPDFPALVVFTSGSTGAPQAIPKKLSQLTSEVAALEALFGAAVGDAAVLATVSHQHIYGLLFKVLWPLASGRPVHALSIAFHEALAPALGAAPCVLVASPAHLKRLPAHLDWHGARAMLRAVFSSGGPLDADTALATGRLLGAVPTEVYGSSETGGVAWRRRADSMNGSESGEGGRADDAWQAFPTVAWRIGDDGALAVRSPHLPDDRWLHLADRARATAAGAPGFLLLGRGDRIVKIEEKRISLDAMETALRASGLAAEARVALCVPAAGERQRMAAFIVPTPAGRALLDSDGKAALNGRLRAVLAGVVDAVALPRRWRYLERLPVNAQGKVTLASLLALLDDGVPDTAAAPRLPAVREVQRAPDSVLLELVPRRELLYFDGHFTDAPILPGVAQVDWAITFGRRYFALPRRFRALHALKFQHVIMPDVVVRLTLRHDAAKHCLHFSYASDGGQHASGRIVFDADADNDSDGPRGDADV